MTLSILSDDALKAFASANETQPTLSVQTGKFVVPIPFVNDDQGPLKLPNAKELETIIKSGDFGVRINSAILEGSPQIVPVDGTQVVIINNISPRQARAMQGLYEDIKNENQGLMNRIALREFFETATGIAYDAASNTISAVSDNIGLHGDLYNMSKQTFKNRHHPYGMEISLKDIEADAIKAGYYQKARAHGQGFAISGGFVRMAESGTQQTFPDTAMVQIGADGIVSAIHRNDINVSYETANGEKIVGDNGEINLPTYGVNKIAPSTSPPGADGKCWTDSLGNRTGRERI